jgi:hypothetical protein
MPKCIVPQPFKQEQTYKKASNRKLGIGNMQRVRLDVDTGDVRVVLDPILNLSSTENEL